MIRSSSTTAMVRPSIESALRRRGCLCCSEAPLRPLCQDHWPGTGDREDRPRQPHLQHASPGLDRAVQGARLSLRASPPRTKIIWTSAPTPKPGPELSQRSAESGSSRRPSAGSRTFEGANRAINGSQSALLPTRSPPEVGDLDHDGRAMRVNVVRQLPEPRRDLVLAEQDVAERLRTVRRSGYRLHPRRKRNPNHAAGKHPTIHRDRHARGSGGPHPPRPLYDSPFT